MDRVGGAQERGRERAGASAGEQFTQLTSAIKVILKRKGITYQDLGERIGMSESGLKKLLTAEDGSVGRLESICSALGMSLLDLVQTAAEDVPIQEITFTPATEDYLVANPECFHVYWKLVYEELSVERAAADLGLSERDMGKHLRQLDKLGLLTLHAGNRVGLPKRGHHLWVGNGPLLVRLRELWSRSLLEDTLEAVPESPDHLIGLRYFRLTRASAVELKEAIRELYREFGNRSVRERLVQSDDRLVGVRSLAIVAPGSFVKA
jgi:transcriptional regulator with XRE-family HTH domain